MLIYVFALRSEVYCTIRFYNTEKQLSSNCLKARHSSLQRSLMRRRLAPLLVKPYVRFLIMNSEN